VALNWQPIDTYTEPDDVDAWRRGDPADHFDLPDLAGLLHRPRWHAHAACRGLGTDLWFVVQGGSTAAARAVCKHCPVRAECLRAALSMPDSTDSGIWAGTSVNDRTQLRRMPGAYA
jgi:WhiB family transcriptional regulator, redox-sensing transcriptional regulator